MIEGELVSGAAGKEKVEEVYAGVVADNLNYTRLAFAKLALVFPLLVYVGCCAHGFNLMMEDVVKIPEFKEVIDACVRMAKFVKSHGRVLEAFKRIIGESGRMLIPASRLACADSTLESCISNKGNLEALIDDEQWAEATSAVSASLVTQFEADVLVTKWGALRSLHKLLGPLDKMIHHVESCGARASWPYALVSALISDTQKWIDSDRAKRYFAPETLQAAKDAVVGRSLGSRQVGLKNSAHIVASLLDPFTTPEADRCPVGWQTEAEAVISKFYPEASSDFCGRARRARRSPPAPRSIWGDIIKSQQATLKLPDEMVRRDGPTVPRRVHHHGRHRDLEAEENVVLIRRLESDRSPGISQAC
mmetsp:Transcript_7106/g.21686  ORF Transcript_7106/g.21686 Transcript_7106/m.21686 type:complete len:363 (-) Transcript_7106:351-1439(-)